MKRLIAFLFAALIMSAFAQYLPPAYTRGPSSSTSSVLPGAFPLLAPDGSSTAPSYSFASASNSGMYITSGSRVAFTDSGNFQFSIGTGSLNIRDSTVLGWASSGGDTANIDTGLQRDAAGVIAQRNTTNAQTFRVYNTYTDASNYERGFFSWTGNVLNIGMENAGTGSARSVAFYRSGTLHLTLDGALTVSQLVRPAGDNSIDLGASPSNRFRNVYVGTGVITPILRSTQTTAPTCTSNCGTSPSVAGGDTAGIVTMGATGSPASGWVLTFNGTWAAAPSCIVQSALSTMVVGKMPIAVVTNTTTMTVTTNGTAPANSDKYQYICVGVS